MSDRTGRNSGDGIPQLTNGTGQMQTLALLSRELHLYIEKGVPAFQSFKTFQLFQSCWRFKANRIKSTVGQVYQLSSSCRGKRNNLRNQSLHFRESRSNGRHLLSSGSGRTGPAGARSGSHAVDVMMQPFCEEIRNLLRNCIGTSVEQISTWI